MQGHGCLIARRRPSIGQVFPWAVVLVLLFASLGLRLWNLPGQMTLLWDDEGIFMYQAWRLVSGDLPYKDLFLADTPMSQYLLGVAFKVFGVGPTQARAFVAVTGAVCVFLVYLIGKEAYGHWTGILAATLFSFDPIVFDAARSFRPDYVVLGFELLTIFLFIKAIKRQKRRWAWLCGIALGLGLLTKLVAVFVIGPIIIAALAIRWFRRGFLTLVQIGTAAAVVMLPFILLFLMTAPQEFFFDAYRYHILKGYSLQAGMGWNEKLALFKSIFAPRSVLVYPAAISFGYAILHRDRFTLTLTLMLVFSMSFFFMKYFWAHYFTLAIALLALVCASLLHHLSTVIRSSFGQTHEDSGGRSFSAWVGHSAMNVRTLTYLALALVFIGLVVGLTLLSNIRADIRKVKASEPPNSDTMRGIELTRELVEPGEVIYTDIPFFAVMAGAVIPDGLNDLSNVRMAAALIDATDLTASIEEHDIRVVMLMSGMHRHTMSLPDYRVFNNYLRTNGFQSRYTLYEPTGFTRASIYIRQD